MVHMKNKFYWSIAYGIPIDRFAGKMRKSHEDCEKIVDI